MMCTWVPPPRPHWCVLRAAKTCGDEHPRRRAQGRHFCRTIAVIMPVPAPHKAVPGSFIPDSQSRRRIEVGYHLALIHDRSPQACAARLWKSEMLSLNSQCASKWAHKCHVISDPGRDAVTLADAPALAGRSATARPPCRRSPPKGM